MMVVLIVVLGLAVLGLGSWVAWLRSHPRVIAGEVVRVEVPGPVTEVPVPVPGPERVREITVPEYVRPDDVPAPAIGGQLADPQALPDVPGALPDSAVDGVRLGELYVRAGAVRGVAGRSKGDLRRQVAEISVLDMLVPPVLLSAVAAGQPGVKFSQVGAVQTVRSLHAKLAARAGDLDQLWHQASGQDRLAWQHLDRLLRSVTASLTDPLAEAARRRDTTPDALATELTCVLSRIGDTGRRQHLAFGVGSGPVFVATPGNGPLPVPAPAGPGGKYLPRDHEATWSQLMQTGPSDLLVLCSSTTARLLERIADQLRADWASPPSMVGFLYQLGIPDNLCRDDRAAVCLWEGRGRGPG